MGDADFAGTLLDGVSAPRVPVAFSVADADLSVVVGGELNGGFEPGGFAGGRLVAGRPCGSGSLLLGGSGPTRGRVGPLRRSEPEGMRSLVGPPRTLLEPVEVAGAASVGGTVPVNSTAGVSLGTNSSRNRGQ